MENDLPFDSGRGRNMNVAGLRTVLVNMGVMSVKLGNTRAVVGLKLLKSKYNGISGTEMELVLALYLH